MELEKNIRMLLLLDIYGGLLTVHQRRVLSLSYEDDLSLSEIAEIVGISRQGVRDCIKKGEAQLENADAQLGMLKRELALRDVLQRLRDVNSPALKDIVDHLTTILEGENGI